MNAGRSLRHRVAACRCFEQRITQTVSSPPSQDKGTGVPMTGHTTVPDRVWTIVLAGICSFPSSRLRVTRSSMRKAARLIERLPRILSLHRWPVRPETAISSPMSGNILTALPFGRGSTSRAMVALHGKTGDSRHTRSLVILGRVDGLRRRMTERVDVQSSSRQIFQKGRDAGE